LPPHPQANHLLVFGAECELAPLASDPQAVIDAANERGALTFLAHPVEYASRIAGEEALGWVDWGVTGYTGIELWNYMSSSRRAFPPCCTRCVTPTRRGWNSRAFSGCVGTVGPAIGRGQARGGHRGADAHGKVYSLGRCGGRSFPTSTCSARSTRTSSSRIRWPATWWPTKR